MGAFGLNLDPTLFFIHPLLLREPLVCFHNGPSQNKQNILAAGRMACLSCNQSSRTTPWKPSRVAHRSALSVNSNPSANGQKIDFVVYWDVYDWSLWDDHFLNGLVRLNRGPPFPIGEPVKNKSGEGWGGHLKQTEALVGPLPPGGILNWNAQSNQSHSHRTDVERSPTGWGGIIFLSYREITAADTSPLSTTRFIDMQMLFCRLEWSHYLCSRVKKKYLDITTLLIYCQILIGTTPPPVWFWPIGALLVYACKPPKPKTLRLEILLSWIYPLSSAAESIFMAH